VAIGRNYSEHIKELGNTAPKEPFFFLKPTTSYVLSGGKVEIPSGIIAHHEGARAKVNIVRQNL
jgi:acylpyruvate hydrolase